MTGRAGLAKPGYPSGAAWASSQLEGTGIYSLYVQTANYSGRELPPVSISQSFNVVTPGVYELNFSYASRPFSSNSGGMIYARVYKGEGLEGELIWEKFVTATSLNAFQHFVGNLKLYDAGKYTLQFYAPQLEYIATGENNRCSVIDNVSLQFHHKIKGFIISFF